MLFTSVFWTSTITETEGSTLDMASTAKQAMKKEPPEPPNCSGISIPIKPISKRDLITSGSIFWASSISSTFGPIVVFANFSISSKNIFSSSVKTEIGFIFTSNADYPRLFDCT